MKTIEKYIWKFILILGFVCISLTASAAGMAEEKKVAVVNDTIISQEAFDRELARVQQQITRGSGYLSDTQIQTLKKDVLESMIGRELVFQESRNKGIKVDVSEIDRQWDKIKGSFPGDAELKSALDSMNLTEEIVRLNISQDLAVNRVIEDVIVSNTVVSEEESRAYYDSHPEAFTRPEEIRASHILIKVDDGADESQKAGAMKRIKDIQDRLKKGDEFEAVARELSECPSSENGGDLDYFSRGVMAKPFEDAAFALKTGELSGIVETQFGYHLIKKTDQRPETVIPLESIKDRLQESIKNDKIQKKIVDYISVLKEKAKIERYMKVNPE